MARWQRKLILNPEWDLAGDGKLSVQKLAASIAGKLKALRPLPDEDVNDDRDDLVSEFKDLSTDDSATMGNFDALMYDLYNWGDQSLDDSWNGRKVCWIDTMTEVEAT